MPAAVRSPKCRTAYGSPWSPVHALRKHTARADASPCPVSRTVRSECAVMCCVAASQGGGRLQVLLKVCPRLFVPASASECAVLCCHADSGPMTGKWGEVLWGFPREPTAAPLVRHTGLHSQPPLPPAGAAEEGLPSDIASQKRDHPCHRLDPPSIQPGVTLLASVPAHIVARQHSRRRHQA